MDENTRKNIYGGIIVSVIMFIFIEPILRWVSTIFLRFGGQAFKYFVDAIYENAAMGNQASGDVILALIYALILLIFSIIVFILSWENSKVVFRISASKTFWIFLIGFLLGSFWLLIINY